MQNAEREDDSQTEGDGPDGDAPEKSQVRPTLWKPRRVGARGDRIGNSGP